VSASSRPGDRVLDLFAGSGATGAVAHAMDGRFILIDRNPAAIEIMTTRLPSATVVQSSTSD
jgi:site-specific DNA-methyltransferase (adenine-specific)